MESAIFWPCSSKKILTALGFHDVCDGNEPHPIAGVHRGEVKGQFCGKHEHRSLLVRDWGQLRGPSSETGTPRACYRSGSIIAPVGLEICDGGDWLGVMKKSQRP